MGFSEVMEKMGADPEFSKYFTTCVADSKREGMINPSERLLELGTTFTLTMLQSHFISSTSYRLSRIALMAPYLANPS